MTKEYSNNLVDIILLIMKRKDITQISLADSIGISKYTLGNYLSKRRPMPYDTAISIAKVLNIDINKLHNLSSYPLNEDDYKLYEKFKEFFNEYLKDKSSH